MLNKKLIKCIDTSKTTIEQLVNKILLTNFQGSLWPIVSELFLDPLASHRIYQTIAAYALAINANKIVCVADYGLPWAGPVAHLLGIPLVVAGESNKMPGRKYTSPWYEENYHKERKQMEIICEHINKNDRILIIDDKIRSGAQIRGVVNAIDPTEYNIAGIFSLTNFSLFNKNSIHYQELINSNIKLYSLFQINNRGKITVNNDYSEVPVFSDKTPANHCIKKNLSSFIKLYPNFPKQGIDWTDFSKFQLSPDLYNYIIYTVAAKFRAHNINKIVCFDVRGQDFASAIANSLAIPLVIIRKTSRLADPVFVTTRLNMEYASNVEIGVAPGLIKPHDNIGVFDDILATGGTLFGGIKICETFSAKVSICATLIHLLDVSMHHPDSKLKLIQDKGITLDSLIKLRKEDLVKIK